QAFQDRSIGDVAFDEREWLAQTLKLVQIPLLQRRIIERVEIVDGPDGVPHLQQSLADMGANKSGPAGHQKIHRANPNLEPALLAMMLKEPRSMTAGGEESPSPEKAAASGQ